MSNIVKAELENNVSLSSSDLVSIYSQQWEQIRHLDMLDFRMMSLLPVVVGILSLGVGLIDKLDSDVSDAVLLSVVIITLGISFAGCYTTFRNWLCYMRRFAILNSLEKEMGMVNRGIIGKSRQFTCPKGYLAFNKSLIRSIRFPLVSFYSALGGCSVLLYTGEVTGFYLTLGILLALLIFFYCNFVTYKSFKMEFDT